MLSLALVIFVHRLLELHSFVVVVVTFFLVALLVAIAVVLCAVVQHP